MFLFSFIHHHVLRPTFRQRKRSNEDNPETQAEPAITKSESFWFDDGNVIFQVEKTQFRVHRSVLSRNSSVFKDMFDIPQPANSNKEEELDGCPLIHLSDKASDFGVVISMIYDGLRECDMRAPISFDECAAMLRLGHKYEIQHLFNKGLERFQPEFPSDLAGWDELVKQKPGKEIAVDGEGMFCKRAMALAHELSINRALPSICLTVVQMQDTSEIVDSLERHSDPPENSYVPAHLWHQWLAGRDKIHCRVHQKLMGWACSSNNSPIPGKYCNIPELCKSSKLSVIMELSSDPLYFKEILIMNTAWLPANCKRLICKICVASLEAAGEEFRADLRDDLPSIFKIGDSWEDLKDF